MKLKFILASLMFILSISLHAQTFQEKINHIFDHVDLNQVPSGSLR